MYLPFLRAHFARSFLRTRIKAHSLSREGFFVYQQDQFPLKKFLCSPSRKRWGRAPN